MRKVSVEEKPLHTEYCAVMALITCEYFQYWFNWILHNTMHTHTHTPTHTYVLWKWKQKWKWIYSIPSVISGKDEPLLLVNKLLLATPTPLDSTLVTEDVSSWCSLIRTRSYSWDGRGRDEEKDEMWTSSDTLILRDRGGVKGAWSNCMSLAPIDTKKLPLPLVPSSWRGTVLRRREWLMYMR